MVTAALRARVGTGLGRCPLADPKGRALHRTMTSGHWSDPAASGLLAGVDHPSFAGDTAGWALAATGRCANGPQECGSPTR
jgi:hypothetical protein